MNEITERKSQSQVTYEITRSTWLYFFRDEIFKRRVYCVSGARGGAGGSGCEYLATIPRILAPISTGSLPNDNRFRESDKRGVKCIHASPHMTFFSTHVPYVIALLLKSYRIRTWAGNPTNMCVKSHLICGLLLCKNIMYRAREMDRIIRFLGWQ